MISANLATVSKLWSLFSQNFGHHQPRKIVINKKCPIFPRLYGTSWLLLLGAVSSRWSLSLDNVCNEFFSSAIRATYTHNSEIYFKKFHHFALVPRLLKPGSHRQDMAQDTARTCHDQEFRSENSFNSWSWQRPGQCPSKIVGVLGAPTTKGWSGQILGHVQVFATISPESQDKVIIADTSGTCPGRFRDMT